MEDEGRLPVPRVTIVEQDEDVVEIEIEGQRATIVVIAAIQRDGDNLVLNGTHLHGPGAGMSSLPELRQAVRELGRQQGVKSVTIYGAMRTTGANPGRVPRPITVNVDLKD